MQFLVETTDKIPEKTVVTDFKTKQTVQKNTFKRRKSKNIHILQCSDRWQTLGKMVGDIASSSNMSNLQNLFSPKVLSPVHLDVNVS